MLRMCGWAHAIKSDYPVDDCFFQRVGVLELIAEFLFT